MSTLLVRFDRKICVGNRYMRCQHPDVEFTYVDHTSRVAVLEFSRLLEKREEAHGHEETLRNVRSVGIDPVFNVRVLVVE